jgi:hypothetical protein
VKLFEKFVRREPFRLAAPDERYLVLQVRVQSKKKGEIMDIKTEKFNEYAIVEMMGHRKIAAKVTEPEIGGSTLLRCDVLNAKGEFDRTEYIGVASIYCLTIVSKEVAEKVAENYTPEPSWAWSLPKQIAAPSEDFEDAEEWQP